MWSLQPLPLKPKGKSGSKKTSRTKRRKLAPDDNGGVAKSVCASTMPIADDANDEDLQRALRLSATAAQIQKPGRSAEESSIPCRENSVKRRRREQDEIKLENDSMRSEGASCDVSPAGKQKKRENKKSEVLALDQLGADEAGSVAADVWTEVYHAGRWQPVECIHNLVDRSDALEKAATKPVHYVIGVDGSGKARDVTERYASLWLTDTRKLRDKPDEWRATLAGCAAMRRGDRVPWAFFTEGGGGAAAAADIIASVNPIFRNGRASVAEGCGPSEADDLAEADALAAAEEHARDEDESTALEKSHTAKGIPGTFSALKSHLLYVAKRHVRHPLPPHTLEHTHACTRMFPHGQGGAYYQA